MTLLEAISPTARALLAQNKDERKFMNTNTIEEHCKKLTDARARLRKKFEARQKALNAIDQEHGAGIRSVQEECTVLRAALEKELNAGRELFKKPKTRVFFGVEVGFEKGRDSVILPEEEILIDRIEKLLPKKQADTLLDRSVSVIKAAFKKLPMPTLQLLGCSRVNGGDKPVIRCNDDDIEDLVKKSLGQPETK